MADLKSARPSRDALGEALEMADKAEYHPDVARMLAREVRALQHGMEELSHEWREQRNKELAAKVVERSGDADCSWVDVELGMNDADMRHAGALDKLREGK